MRTRKTGVFTISLGLIVSGILMILFQIDLVSAEVFKYVGPLFLVLFGLEIIWGRLRQSDQPAKMSGWSVVFIIIILIVSLSQSTVSANVLWQNRYFSPVSGEVTVDSAVKQVDIRIPDGQIIVTGTDKEVLSYDGELTAYGSSQAQANERIKAHWTVRTSGDTVELILEQSGIRFSLSQLFQWNFQPPVLHVEVPQALLTKVQTDNGKIDIQNMNADVELKTSNGVIAARNINGDVNAETSNGAQTIADIDGSVDLRTQNGAVAFSHISGALSAKTSNGAIKGVSAVNGKWDVQTSNGKINLTLPGNTNATVQGKTSNGNIGGNIPWRDNGKNNCTAVLGTGDNAVTLSTSNGSISVDAGT